MALQSAMPTIAMRYDFQSELMLTSSCKGFMHVTVQWTAVAASSIVDICSFNCAARTLACATDDLATGMTAQAYHPTTPLPLRAILAKSHSMEGTDFPDRLCAAGDQLKPTRSFHVVPPLLKAFCHGV